MNKLLLNEFQTKELLLNEFQTKELENLVADKINNLKLQQKLYGLTTYGENLINAMKIIHEQLMINK